ncbi:unnamed protein product [Aspergillus oryzae]|uniref:Adenine deaminase n=1 Tax=Aspergillus oryzae var. brunneus TaxID=332754 RepID=A0ABQ6L9Z2_ASPOZ|nr:unnamed protein product [Aspergillus oryzae]GMF95941.1 unnamed protein product [Aspergillus oryzae]GMG54887.1 unnamed protein product [Aspergillus oryzae var. brunneus]
MTFEATSDTLAPLSFTAEQLDSAAAKCVALQQSGRELHSKRPFAALLLSPDNETVLISSLSLSHVRHAECEVARNAADNYDWNYLAKCTMVSTWEPCAMCAGTIYWAHIGRLVYLASEKTLQELIGAGNVENLTLDLPCRAVFAAGQTPVEVSGPLKAEGWEQKLVFSLARKNKIALPDLPHFQSPDALAARYDRFDNLDDFLNIHYANMSVLITEDDFYELVWYYVLAAHADGVHHAEVFFDPQSHTPRGVPIASVTRGYKRALDRAESELEVTSCLIMCFLRHLPVASAEATFDSVNDFIRDGSIHAVGLDSSEVEFPPELFTDVFQKAKEVGLRHAERIDHGIRLVEDQGLLKEIAAKGTLLTICPLSNVYLRTVKSIASLPLREFLDSGVQFSLNSDDPAYFGDGILNNYCAVQEAFGFSIDDWKTIAISGVRGSWIGDERKRVLLEKIADVAGSFKSVA